MIAIITDLQSYLEFASLLVLFLKSSKDQISFYDSVFYILFNL